MGHRHNPSTATEGMMSCTHPRRVEHLHRKVSSAQPVLQEECCKVSNARSEDKVLNQQGSGPDASRTAQSKPKYEHH